MIPKSIIIRSILLIHTQSQKLKFVRLLAWTQYTLPYTVLLSLVNGSTLSTQAKLLQMVRHHKLNIRNHMLLPFLTNLLFFNEWCRENHLYLSSKLHMNPKITCLLPRSLSYIWESLWFSLPRKRRSCYLSHTSSHLWEILTPQTF